MASEVRRGEAAPRPAFYNDPKIRGLFYQVLVLGIVLLARFGRLAKFRSGLLREVSGLFGLQALQAPREPIHLLGQGSFLFGQPL